MTPVHEIVRRIIALHSQGVRTTLLAVCPNSDAVLEAAVKVAAEDQVPMLFAATLNQVDRDGGYTGWTPRAFVARMRELAERYGCAAPLYPCLDHGGPWLKDAHTRDRLTLAQTMAEVKASLTACLEAGYALLHIDPTVDRTLPPGQPPPIEVVVERTVDLIAHAEAERVRLGLPPVSYEVGTEEVHGGLADFDNFDRFLAGLAAGLKEAGLEHTWPCFVVGKVGTDLGNPVFDPEVARRLYERVAPLGSLIKGHYTDWVENPAAYPAAGMGGANVGPEFTATELDALRALCARERTLGLDSGFEEALKAAVVESNRWRKWLTSDEAGRDFDQLAPERQEWLVATGARYVWTEPRVLAARARLYEHLRETLPDPHGVVVERIARNIQTYVKAFNLQGLLPLLGQAT
ncbi:MAG: class II D-tagatose-bisphosphate aldolase, non-catalytic subunit [Anaerolineae bacterium]|nr:class II D-tagatose-bisphosphate aldolase, non-catalytic subunit [Anaerolineae bacterium]